MSPRRWNPSDTRTEQRIWNLLGQEHRPPHIRADKRQKTGRWYRWPGSKDRIRSQREWWRKMDIGGLNDGPAGILSPAEIKHTQHELPSVHVRVHVFVWRSNSLREVFKEEKWSVEEQSKSRQMRTLKTETSKGAENDKHQTDMHETWQTHACVC